MGVGGKTRVRRNKRADVASCKKLFPFQHNHPYLSAMISNGTMHYDHDRDGTHTMIGGCEVKFRNFEHDTWIAIRYENDVLTGTDLFRNLPIS